MSKHQVKAEKLHATYSASGSDRWLACPGSIALSEKAPPSKSSKWAEEGTNAHSVLEFLIKNRKKRDQAIVYLKKKYSEEMIGHALTALSFIEEKLVELPGAEVHSEIRADLPVSEPDQFGTTDLALVQHFGRLVVGDYKYGAGIPVSATENSQLIYYALGIAHLYDYNFSEVEIVVIQPRAEINGEYIRSWITDIDTLIKWREIFEEGIKRCKDPDAPLFAGNPKDPKNHCRFCPAKTICPEIGNGALRAAQADFDDETGEIALPATKGLSAIQLAKTLPALDKLEVWIDSIREYAEGLLNEGVKISGYAMNPKRPSRVWKDPEKVARLAERTFKDGSAFTAPELKTPPQIEKLGTRGSTFVEIHAVSVSSGLTLGPDKAAKDFNESMKGGKIGDLSGLLSKKTTKTKKR